MKRLALQVTCACGFALGVFAVAAWAMSSEYAGTLITLATVAFLSAGLAFGKLETRS